MSRPLARWQAITLGMVLLLGLGLGMLGLFAIGNRHGLGGDSFRVLAGFADIGGVEVGTPVRLQGIDAGEVEAILPPDRPGGEVRLQLHLAGKLRHLVGSDARVQIAGEGLLPGKIVRIVPGKDGTEPVADGALLASLSAADLTEEMARATAGLNDLLADGKSTLSEFRAGQGPAGQATRDLARAAGCLNNLLARADKALQSLEKGEGTLGQLVKDKEAYIEAVQSLHEVRKMVVSVKQNADAIKSLPIVRSYVIDPNKELIRPNCKRLRRWFPEKELFEPGRAVLTAAGKRLLDGLSAWLNGHKEEGSEVVVASFASPEHKGEYAQTLTQKQSEVVAEYLKSRHKVHRTGFWWWSRRAVRAVGCGRQPSPVPETEDLAPARTELLVFIPEK